MARKYKATSKVNQTPVPTPAPLVYPTDRPTVSTPQQPPSSFVPSPAPTGAYPSPLTPPVANPVNVPRPIPVNAQLNQAKIAPSPPPKKKGVTTQSALLISEIRDGLVIMKDGSLRAVVMCQSINFDLMSPGEREAVEFAYQGFINALYFPIQIFIRSQRVDLNQYIDKLQKIHTSQENILLSLLMEDYIAYVRYLVEAANVMDKQFYVIVPYYPPLVSKTGGVLGGVRRLTTFFRPKTGPIVINQADYARYKAELTQRVQVVLSNLNQMSVQAVPLNTQELIELYYTVYNPQIAANERLTDIDQLEAPMIEKGQGQVPPQLAGDNQL